MKTRGIDPTWLVAGWLVGLTIKSNKRSIQRQAARFKPTFDRVHLRVVRPVRAHADALEAKWTARTLDQEWERGL